MTPKEHIDLSTYPAIDISYSSAKSHYSGQVAALMDKLANSKTSATAKAMKPQDFKWSIVFNRADDPETVTDPELFTRILCTNSKHWLKARGGGWKNYEELSVVPSQVRNNYEQRANLICHQRQAAAAGEPEDNGQASQSSLKHDKASKLREAFMELTNLGGDPRLISVAKSALEMLIEDVLE